jgi:hypothetical protein
MLGACMMDMDAWSCLVPTTCALIRCVPLRPCLYIPLMHEQAHHAQPVYISNHVTYNIHVIPGHAAHSVYAVYPTYPGF